MIRPTIRILWLCWLWVGLAVLAAFLPQFFKLWAIAGALFFLIGALDLFIGARRPALVYSRRLPGRFALGQDEFVTLKFSNRGKRPLKLEVFDGIPENGEADEMPWVGKIERGRVVSIRYPARMLQRGDETFSPTAVQIHSPFSLWKKTVKFGESETVKVYPNYEPLVEYALLATE